MVEIDNIVLSIIPVEFCPDTSLSNQIVGSEGSHPLSITESITAGLGILCIARINESKASCVSFWLLDESNCPRAISIGSDQPSVTIGSLCLSHESAMLAGPLLGAEPNKGYAYSLRF